MSEIAIWLLIAASASHSSPVVIERFASKQECMNVAVEIKRISTETPRVPYMNAFCVPAVIKK